MKSFVKINVLVTIFLSLMSCANNSSLDVSRELLGYIPPPEKTTVTEELKLEYDRCMKVNKDRNCAQVAYDVVRVVKGLEPRKVPRGIVIILEGDGGHGTPEKASEVDPGQ